MLTNTMATSILLQQSINCFICNHQFGKNNLAATKSNFVEKCKKLRDIKARVAVDAMETATSPTAFPFFQTEPKQEDTPASKLIYTKFGWHHNLTYSGKLAKWLESREVGKRHFRTEQFASILCETMLFLIHLSSSSALTIRPFFPAIHWSLDPSSSPLHHLLLSFFFLCSHYPAFLPSDSLVTRSIIFTAASSSLIFLLPLLSLSGLSSQRFTGHSIHHLHRCIIFSYLSSSSALTIRPFFPAIHWSLDPSSSPLHHLLLSFFFLCSHYPAFLPSDSLVTRSIIFTAASSSLVNLSSSSALTIRPFFPAIHWSLDPSSSPLHHLLLTVMIRKPNV
ncbi:hypothetical protein HanRHA438_Chr05g0213261 [Helianthus annuus]|nr:hypothetical protein HanHA89_Chr05g0181101 [Helianthus annuus]KAJ0918063.1 hypothetical protein HanRHA438_Chr05g0213261 [Helianthus annuus]